MTRMWKQGAALVGFLSLGALGCGPAEEAPPADALSQTEQAFVIYCSPNDIEDCVVRGMVCDYEHSTCVPVCADGRVCPTHRDCC